MDVNMDANRVETQADVSCFGGTSRSRDAGVDICDRSEDTNMNPHPIRFYKEDLYYNMAGEKRLIIFNHSVFEKSEYFHNSTPSVRHFTEKDVDQLQNTFEHLGFRAEVHNNLKHSEILNKVSEVSKEDHAGTSCVALAIMTHGSDGYVFAKDRPYELSDVISILQHGQRGLVGKPKLFFVQACRGDSIDAGRRVQTDGKQIIRLPTHADTLITYSSAEKHLSYRETDGSWLMQSLCNVLNEHHQNYDLVQMLTMVHQDVAYRSTYTESSVTDNKKAMPETKFSLTKLLSFKY